MTKPIFSNSAIRDRPFTFYVAGGGVEQFPRARVGFSAGGFRGGPGGATPPAPFCAGFSFGKRVSDGTSSLRAGRVVLSPQWLRPLVAS